VFNGGRKPFDDERVRRAITLSIDRQRVIDVALAGYGTPAYGPVRPDHPYALPTGTVTGRDIALADSLLDAAGWLRGKDGGRSRDGVRLAFALLTVGSADNSVEQLLQSDMSARGIRMEIQQRELASFLALARSERKVFDALFTGIPGDVSLSYLAAMFDSELSGGALDYAGFHSAKLDALFREASAARTDDEARKAWHEVQRYLAQASPVAWVYHARGVQGLSRRLRGVIMDLRGELVSVARWTTESGAAGKETVP
jgi:peptide/nickel transport system substrate-binding protein